MNDKAEWLSGVNHEILFWTRYLQTQGSEWPEDYLFRINPHAELQPYLADLLEGCVGKPKILDVGVGSGKKIKNPLIANRKYSSLNYNKPCFFACIYSDLSRSTSYIYKSINKYF